jgi:DNA-binding response OmpR family regulator
MKENTRILVVDDEIVICKSVDKILSREGYTVDYSLDAFDALKKLRSTRYHVVVTDLMMPKMSGMELLETTRNEIPDLPVIMITGYATFKTAVQAIKLGAFDYIPKPFSPEELSAVVARALERRKLYDTEPERKRIPEAEKVTPPEDVQAVAGEKPAVEAGELYFMPEHSWVRVESDGTVRVGMDDIFQMTVGDIVNIDLPFENEEVKQGKAFAHVNGKGMKIYTLWSPVSGTVIELNEDLTKNASIMNSDPYGKGWIIRVRPADLEEDLENLIPHSG